MNAEPCSVPATPPMTMNSTSLPVSVARAFSKSVTMFSAIAS